MHVAATPQQAEEEYREALMWFFAADSSRTMFGFKRERQPYEYYLNHRSLMLGSPETLARQMAEYRDYTGMQNIVCWFNCGGQPPAQVRRAMELFSAEVMPRLQTAVAV